MKTKKEILKQAYERTFGTQQYESSNLRNTYEDITLTAMEEYKNQFSQLPASVTDEEIEKRFPTVISPDYSLPSQVFAEDNTLIQFGAKWMRSLLNHPPAMGEGEKC